MYVIKTLSKLSLFSCTTAYSEGMSSGNNMMSVHCRFWSFHISCVVSKVSMYRSVLCSVIDVAFSKLIGCDVIVLLNECVWKVYFELCFVTVIM